MSELGGETVAVPLSSDDAHVIRLNATALDIWHGIEDGKAEAEIVDAICAKYGGVSKETVAAEVHSALDDLKKAGIIA